MSTMEGILIELESFAPNGVFLAGLTLLALVATAILLGYTAEEESKGNRLFWAEWPLPGTGEPVSPAIEREYLKAA
ncbi:MAG: hypothetical protein ACXW4J_10830 [Candidatus Deferrimicrobiaceae bacterium]